MNLEKYFDNLTPGFVIDIYNDGKEEEIVCGNKQIIPNAIETSNDTLYDIASLTKVFTSILIYMTYEEGYIKLNDTIYSIDNNFKDLKDVTVFDLVSHNKEIWTLGYLGDAKDKNDFYRILYTAYEKSNNPIYEDAHYIILSTILETIYKKPFSKICDEKILKPLDMMDTTFNPESSRCASNNYDHINDKEIDYIYPGLIHDTKGRIAHEFGINLGHASIFSTGKDIMKLLKSFLNNSLLKEETIKLMLSHRNTNEDNYNKLKANYNGDNINDLYREYISDRKDIILSRTYNNMGVRYRNDIEALNDVPNNASNNSVFFSGFTGPMFTIDFDKKIIIVIMCNVIHNTKLNKIKRKELMVEVMNNVFDYTINKNII